MTAHAKMAAASVIGNDRDTEIRCTRATAMASVEQLRPRHYPGATETCSEGDFIGGRQLSD